MNDWRNTAAEAYASRKDGFTGLRQQVADEFYNCGRRDWIAKWLATKAIEDLIDAKIAAALKE